MPIKDDKVTVSARVFSQLIDIIETIRLRENRNRTQVYDLILDWYYNDYKPENQTFNIDFSKYIVQDGKKQVTSFRISNELNNSIEKDCQTENRSRSQLLECILITYLVEKGYMK